MFGEKNLKIKKNKIAIILNEKRNKSCIQLK